jgi:uncharacterized protein (UPF0276 family)
MSPQAQTEPELGVGIGWRPELAGFVAALDDLRFVEVVAESIAARTEIPRPLRALRARGVQVIPHGLKLSLGGARKPDRKRLAHLAKTAERLQSPLVSEHIAFVRAGGQEAGHLMPVPRTEEALGIVIENVLEAQKALPVPLALEHVAALIEWPESELDEAAFIAGILEATGAQLLLDLSNLHANGHNHGFAPAAFLDRIPLQRIAYVHVGGGVERDGIYLDTHTDPVQPQVLTLVEELCARTSPPGVLLERDDDFPPPAALAAELAAIATAIDNGIARRPPQ